MKPLIIAGNWKSNKTTAEAMRWLQDFKTSHISIPSHIRVVLCVPFTLLYTVKEEIKVHKLPMELGAQNVSPFPDGAETGEESARMVKDLADWVIIGHSERRKNFNETDELLAKKVEQAKKVGLRVMYCVQDESISIPNGIDVVGYEPPWAISAVSNGKSQSAEEANKVCTLIKKKFSDTPVIYGGSASPDNITSYIHQPAIDGVLSGGASLISEKFVKLISAAAHCTV